MRRLAWLIVVLAVLWVAWWAAATTGAQNALLSWIDDRQAQGWRAEVGEVSKHGFPTKLHLSVQDLAVIDPVAQMGVEAPQVDLITPTYWPGYMNLQLRAAPIRITTPLGQVALHSDTTNADLWLDPGLALGLNGAFLASGPFRISNRGGDLVAADGFAVSAMRDEDDPHSYLFAALVLKPFPGVQPRKILGLPETWPLVLDAFDTKFSVTFDGPLDRSALGTNPPQIRHVIIDNASISWGDLEFEARGDVSIDANGVPTGTISIYAANWRRLLDLVQAAGILAPGLRPQTEIMFSALANLSGEAKDLNLDIVFENAQMKLGTIHLGPAPRLILR